MLHLVLSGMLRRSSQRNAPVPAGRFAATRPLRSAILAGAALLLVVLFTGEIRDTDVWLHMKTGQHTWESRALTVPDPFSYTSDLATAYPGEEVTRYFNLTHEWLAQTGIYVIYRCGGFPALVTIRAVLLILFCATVGWIVFRRTENFALGVAAALSAAGLAFHFQQSRPFLVTFVALAVTMAVLETRRRLWLLPPLFLIWANCHSGFFMGWAVLAAYCGEALTDRMRRKPQPHERQLWLVTAACIAASALNPNGYRVLSVLLFYRGSQIQTDNLEWQKPMFWEPGFYSLLLFGSLAVLLLARRRARPADWLLYLCFGAISLLAVRNVIFLALVGPIVMATYLPKWRYLPAAAVAATASALLVFDVVPAAADGNVLAFRAAGWQLPSGCADFIREHGITERLFNSYESGGYLVWRLWPLQRDFLDPRGLSEQAYADYRRILMNIGPNGEKSAGPLLAKYGIGMIVVEGFDFLSGQVYPLVAELATAPSSEWKLVYADGGGVILMRPPPPGVPPLDPANALLPALEAQCEVHMRHDSRRPNCARGLAEFYSVLGQTERAQQWIATYLEHRTVPDPEAERIRQSLAVTRLNEAALAQQAAGDLAGAERALRQALAMAEQSLGPDHPDTAGTLNNLGSVLESEGNDAAAEALYRRTLAICEKTLGPADPRTARALQNLGGLLGARGDYAAAEPLYRRALLIAEKTLGHDDPGTRQMQEEFEQLTNRSRGRQK